MLKSFFVTIYVTKLLKNFWKCKNCGNHSSTSSLQRKYPILAVLCGISNLQPLSERLMFVIDETNAFRICYTPVDMRRGILRLSQLERSYDFIPPEGVAYVFYDRSRNWIKLLHLKRCVFVDYHKQMAQGFLSPKIIRVSTRILLNSQGRIGSLYWKNKS